MCTRPLEPRPRRDVAASETLAETLKLPRLSRLESRELQRLAETFSVTWCAPSPDNFWKFYLKIMHFDAKFSLVLRCIRSIGGRPLTPTFPLESATVCRLELYFEKKCAPYSDEKLYWKISFLPFVRWPFVRISAGYLFETAQNLSCVPNIDGNRPIKAI